MNKKNLPTLEGRTSSKEASQRLLSEINKHLLEAHISNIIRYMNLDNFAEDYTNLGGIELLALLTDSQKDGFPGRFEDNDLYQLYLGLDFIQHSLCSVNKDILKYLKSTNKL